MRLGELYARLHDLHGTEAPQIMSLAGRLLSTVLPVASVLAVFGYLGAQLAGGYVANAKDDGTILRSQLAWQLPLAMAFWGGLFTLLFELARWYWFPKPTQPVTQTGEVDAEALLQQLLAEADAAELARQQGSQAVAEELSADSIFVEQTPPPKESLTTLPNTPLRRKTTA